MTATEMHRARVTLHRLVTARTFGAFEAAAMQLGMPPYRSMAPAAWLRQLRWRAGMWAALLWTAPYRAGGVRLMAN